MEKVESILKDILAELKAMRTQTVPEPRPFMTIEEVAGHCRLSVKTIRNQLSAGKFPLRPTRIGGRVLFRKEEVENFGR